MQTAKEIVLEVYPTFRSEFLEQQLRAQTMLMEKYADQYKIQWKSTDDSYPHVEDDYDFSEPVLICHNIDKWNARGVYQHGVWYNDFDTENECFPTHWMPMPEYPQI